MSFRLLLIILFFSMFGNKKTIQIIISKEIISTGSMHLTDSHSFPAKNSIDKR